MKKFNKLLYYFLVLSMVLTLLPYHVDAATKKKIELSEKSITLINSNKKIHLKNVPKNQYKNIKWKSTNTKVIKIQYHYDNVCAIKFVGTGSCYITATLNKKTYKCKVVAYSKKDYNNKVFKENIINTSVQETNGNILYSFCVNKKFNTINFIIEYLKDGKCIEKQVKSISGAIPNKKYYICFDKQSTSTGYCDYDSYEIKLNYIFYNEKIFKENEPSCIEYTSFVNRVIESGENIGIGISYIDEINLKNNSNYTKKVEVLVLLYNENKLVGITQINQTCLLYPNSTDKIRGILFEKNKNGKLQTSIGTNYKDIIEFDDMKIIVTSATTIN